MAPTIAPSVAMDFHTHSGINITQYGQSVNKVIIRSVHHDRRSPAGTSLTNIVVQSQAKQYRECKQTAVHDKFAEKMEQESNLEIVIVRAKQTTVNADGNFNFGQFDRCLDLENTQRKPPPPTCVKGRPSTHSPRIKVLKQTLQIHLACGCVGRSPSVRDRLHARNGTGRGGRNNPHL